MKMCLMYLHLVASCMAMVCMRPDIAHAVAIHAVGILNQFLSYLETNIELQ